MSDPFAHVQPGQKFRPSAAAWNAAIDAAKAHVANQFAPRPPDPAARPGGDAGVVLVKNNTDAVLPRFGIASITRTIIDPGDAGKAREFVRRVALLIDKPKSNKPFVVCCEPIPAGRMGHAWIDGVCHVKIDVREEWHDSASPAANDTAELVSSPIGSASILWKEAGTGSGKWAVVKLGRQVERSFLLRSLSGGVPARDGDTAGKAPCRLLMIEDSDEIVDVLDADNQPIELECWNVADGAVGEGKIIQAKGVYGKPIIDFEECD